jgi:hypothetical protein
MRVSTREMAAASRTTRDNAASDALREAAGFKPDSFPASLDGA